MKTKAYATQSAESQLTPFSFDRREVGPEDVRIDIAYCGVCHSDIHQARNEWGGSIYPMVPGHEIVGTVSAVGKAVTRFKVGDRAGVGCFVDSCRVCDACKAGEQQYCQTGMCGTYNSKDRNGNPTYGGYSDGIVVDQNYTLKVPANLELSAVAPLLCAGITTYSPLRTWKVGPGQRIGVVGLGGLGHMAVKLGAAMGAEVTVLSTSRSKQSDASRLGAADFIATAEEGALGRARGRFDFLIDTVSAPHDINAYLNLLKRDGTMVLVGVPPKSTELDAISLIGGRRRLAGSLIGGIPQTQEMLDYCGSKGITSDVEVIAAKEINGAYERMLRADVRYRFVIDCATL